MACAAEQLDLDEVSSGVVVDNKIAANTLSQNKIAANTLGANKIAANTLSNNHLTLNQSADDLLATEDGREVLSFIISCALKEDTIVTGEFGGETFEFFGDLGLAPRWIDHPLDNQGEGWVSACLFARVNASAIAVPISLRGPHQRLTADDDEKAIWSLQEGAFYGNYFTGDDPIDWNACRGADQAAGEIAGLTSRDCAEPDGNTGLTLCGFKYAGDCGDFGNDDERACKSFSENGTYYKKCRNEPEYDNKKGHGHGHGWGHHKAYKQVITVYVLGS